MELHVHRQMLQVLNQEREEKLELRNTAHEFEDKESVVKMSHSESNMPTKVSTKIIKKIVRRSNSFALNNR